MYFRIAFLLLIAGCGGLQQTELVGRTFCGLSVPTKQAQSQVAPHVCSERNVFCPMQKSSITQTRFCETSYTRDTEFWLECGPTEPGPICNPDSCQSLRQSTSHPQVDPQICQAIDLSVLVQAATKEVVKSKLEVNGATLKRWVTDAGDLSFIYYETVDSQWLVFAPSITSCNWIADLNYERVKVPELGGMMIHRGFYDIAKASQQQIKSAGLRFNSQKPLYIAGHSLGGAIALVTALLLAQENQAIAGVLTFGQPQITDAAGVAIFEQQFKSKISLMRTINKNDLIPTGLIIFDESYQHFGPELRLETDPNTGQTVYALLAQADGRRLTGELNLSKLSDHMQPAYLASLKAIGCKITYSEAVQ